MEKTNIFLPIKIHDHNKSLLLCKRQVSETSKRFYKNTKPPHKKHFPEQARGFSYWRKSFYIFMFYFHITFALLNLSCYVLNVIWFRRLFLLLFIYFISFLITLS